MMRRADSCALRAPTRTIALLLLAMAQGCAGELDDSLFPNLGGGAGSGGGVDAGGSVVAAAGCAEAPGIFTAHQCDACHDKTGQYANFDMASPGWETRLVGVRPKGGGATSPSTCMSPARDYLVAGTAPATGLFLDKLKPKPACGAQMPTTFDYLSVKELDCVQRWANALTAP